MITTLPTTKPNLKKIFSVFLIAFTSLLYTQSEGKIWYFGSNAGLDFKTNPPTILNDGQLNTLEGTASIADENGNLLFYTDGVSAYTQNHTLMPNGAGGLGGNSSSAQSALVVPHPGNSDLFYLFTVSEYTHSNLVYSLIDMSLNNGLGDVVANSKALPVLSDTGEYLQATPSEDGSFWWVLAHKNGTADYYAYKVTANGLEINQPVISTSGTASSALGSIGFMKFNNLGSKIVRTSYMQHYFEISDFNNATGEVSNSINLPFQGAYGAEFSPNNRFLYISGYSNLGLKQFDLDAGSTASTIQATAYTFSNLMNGAIQIAPDGKIYSSRHGANALDAIQEPNQPGAGANFQLNFQSLGTASTQLGLPNIINNLVSQSAPMLEELLVSNITDAAATLSVNVSSDGGSSIIERGFYFGTDTTSISNTTLVQGSTGLMLLQLQNLVPDTIYYFGAFVTNQHGTRHLSWESFSTLIEIDTIPPVAICHENITLELDEYGYAYLTSQMVDNGSYDNDAIGDIFIDKTEFSCADIGQNTVTLTVVDVSGNSSMCTTTIYVQDSIAPEIFVELDSNIQQITINERYMLPDYFSEGFAWVLDNCTTLITELEQTPQPDTLLDVGTHLISLSATDKSGNTATVSFEISVETFLNATDFNSDFDLSIYPNPTTDYFNISNQNQLNIDSIEIFDLNGRLLNSFQIKVFQEIDKVNVSHLAESVYLVVIKGEGKTSTNKLIKR